ncbi:hypothetical protein CRG98_030495 [Punica granatum]|uniref:Uncharacterized protein n=1 Tax=Punica granatum TaxID=22663 RepID=A0A2I0IYS1_PUNGR|nr:hypothetical protein CRG98_030495 [Punica granatum]
MAQVMCNGAKWLILVVRHLNVAKSSLILFRQLWLGQGVLLALMPGVTCLHARFGTMIVLASYYDSVELQRDMTCFYSRLHPRASFLLPHVTSLSVMLHVAILDALDSFMEGVRTQISSHRDPHACALIARLVSIHLLGGRATDTREKESPLPVYDPKVRDRRSKEEQILKLGDRSTVLASLLIGP